MQGESGFRDTAVSGSSRKHGQLLSRNSPKRVGGELTDPVQGQLESEGFESCSACATNSTQAHPNDAMEDPAGYPDARQEQKLPQQTAKSPLLQRKRGEAGWAKEEEIFADCQKRRLQTIRCRTRSA